MRSLGVPRERVPVAAGAAILALAALSLLLPSVPTTDPWGWIVWGREVAHLDLNTAIGGSPSWKPLPVLFTTPYSLAGGAVAPSLWLVTARAAGLVALLMAFRVAARLGGRGAGAVAVVGVALSGDFVRALAHGYTEPLMIALALGAVDRHQCGRRGQALALLFLSALGRPEGFVFLVGYGAYAAWREPRLWPRAAGLVLVAPALWLGGDWWGSGDPLHAEKVARAVSRGGPGIQRAELVPVLGPWLLALAVVGCALAWQRGRREPAALAALALGWVACVLGPTWDGSAASNRFLAPAVAAGCVLAGVGAAELVRRAPVRGRWRPALAAVLLVAALPLVVERAEGVENQVDGAEAQARAQGDLREAVAAALRNRDPGLLVLPGDLGWNEGALAWQLGVGLDRIGVLPLRHVRPDRLARAVDLSGRRGTPVYSMPRDLGQRVTLLAPFRGLSSVGAHRVRVRRLGGGDGWQAFRLARGY